MRSAAATVSPRSAAALVRQVGVPATSSGPKHVPDLPARERLWQDASVALVALAAVLAAWLFLMSVNG